MDTALAMRSMEMLTKALERVEAQRDALLAACKLALVTVPDSGEAERRRDIVRAAIALAEEDL